MLSLLYLLLTPLHRIVTFNVKVRSGILTEHVKAIGDGQWKLRRQHAGAVISLASR